MRGGDALRAGHSPRAFARERAASAASGATVELVVVQGGAHSDEARSIRTNGGDLASCTATESSGPPGPGCANPLRLKLTPLTPSVYAKLELDSYEIVAKEDPRGKAWDLDGSPPDPVFALGSALLGPYTNSMQQRVAQPLTDLVEIPDEGFRLTVSDDDLFLEAMGGVTLARRDLTTGTLETTLTHDGKPVVKVTLRAEVRVDAVPVVRRDGAEGPGHAAL